MCLAKTESYSACVFHAQSIGSHYREKRCKSTCARPVKFLKKVDKLGFVNISDDVARRGGSLAEPPPNHPSRSVWDRRGVENPVGTHYPIHLVCVFRVWDCVCVCLFFTCLCIPLLVIRLMSIDESTRRPSKGCASDALGLRLFGTVADLNYRVRVLFGTPPNMFQLKYGRYI